jgi:hypothetical protein
VGPIREDRGLMTLDRYRAEIESLSSASRFDSPSIRQLGDALLSFAQTRTRTFGGPV